MTLDRPDWKCRVGDSAVFRVTLLRGGHELPRAKVSVALAQERRRRTVAYGVIRAGDFLFSLPQFDGTNYVVQGGSQGGHLALVAGALDARVKAVSASYPAMSDHLGYLRARAGGWPHIFADTTKLRAIAEKKELLVVVEMGHLRAPSQTRAMDAWLLDKLGVPARKQ